MERAQRGVKRAQPDTPAPSLERGQRKGRGVNTSLEVGGTAQTPASGRAACAVPASAERQGVEVTTEEMGAGECTQTPGAPAAGRSAAPTLLRDKCALPHGDSDVPLMAPLTPALKSTINTSSSAEAALPNGESGGAVDGTAMPSSPVRPVVWLDVFSSPTPEDPARRTPRTPQARDGFRQRVVRSGTADSIDGHTQRAKRESITRKLTASARHWNVDDWRDRVRVTGIYALELCGVRGVVVNKNSNGHREQHVNSTARVEAHAACDSLLDRLHASDILHVTPRQIFRALPAHIRHVGCVDASCDGGSKCSSYEDFLGYVGQSLCARAQSTLRERARACLHDRRQNNTLPARSTRSQFTVELHGLVCDDVGRGLGLRRDGDLDCLPVYFHPVVRKEVDDFVGAHTFDDLKRRLDGSSLVSSLTDHGFIATRLRAVPDAPPVSRRGSGRAFTVRVVERAKTLMRSWIGRFFPRSNNVDATRLNAFQMGTGTTGVRAMNLAKRALAEDQCLQRERVEHTTSVRGGNKVRASLVGGEGSGCQ